MRFWETFALIAITNFDSSIQDHRHNISGFCYKLRSLQKKKKRKKKERFIFSNLYVLVSRKGSAAVVDVYSGLCVIQKRELLCEGDGDKSLQEFHFILPLII